MVVDDLDPLREGMVQALQGAGHEVVAQASNGKEAVEQAKEAQPQVILLDVQMPEMTGIEALPQIRADVPDAVIVMLTSEQQRTTVQSALENGADHYVLKGDGVNDAVFERIRTVAERRGIKLED